VKAKIDNVKAKIQDKKERRPWSIVAYLGVHLRVVQLTKIQASNSK
jgi:hypothetical protein